MLARLWWKEYRAFGPAWLILVLAAGLLQWLFLSTGSEDSRQGALTVSALCWAVLYAFASGAAAFAGEREAKTIGFLDALPVPRGALWLGKASFVLVSTSVLALLLAGLAALGTEARDPVAAYNYKTIVRVFGTVLFEAAAWSLLWSSLSRNPLLAGVMGVLSLYASAVATEVVVSPPYRSADYDIVGFEVMPARLMAALAALAISGIVMTWKPRAKAPAPSRRGLAEAPRVAIRASSTGRSLAWQARREGWTTWLFVALVGLILATNGTWLDSPSFGGIDLVLAVLACLVAGVSVFGTENASGSRPFLVRHGVRPGTAWWRKFLTWGVVVGSIFGLSLFTSGALWAPPSAPGILGARRDLAEWLALTGLALANGFAIGTLCGMTIPRRITATLLGVIVVVALVPLQVVLVREALVPAWGVFFVPLIFAAASRAWADDWMLEREGARPWLKLGAWLALPFGLLVAAGIGYRGFGVPDVGRLRFFQTDLQTVEQPRPGEDAASWYRGASNVIRRAPGSREITGLGIDEMIEKGWDPAKAEFLALWKENLGAIDLARRTSAFPRGRFEDVGRLTLAGTTDPSVANAAILAQLLALDTRERLSRSDLPGAWDDLLAQLRMANQLATNSPTLARMIAAATIHHRAVGLAFDWLGAPGQSSEVIRKALLDLKALPSLPSLAAAVPVESSIIERSLDLPGAELADMLFVGLPRRPTTFDYLMVARVIAAPWERQRARRVCRLLLAREAPGFWVEPYLRPAVVGMQAGDGDAYFLGSTLARRIYPNFGAITAKLDRELVGRRALDQAVAIEAWKFAHDGQFPETLEALVPELLPALPLDPYDGTKFGYINSDGRPILPPILGDSDPFRNQRPSRPGQPLLYSVGPDKADDGGRIFLGSGQPSASDYVYAIP